MNVSQLLRIAGAALLTTAAVGCQRIEPPTPIPTADQWRRVQEHLLEEAPTPQHAVNMVFEDKIRLVGWDIEPTPVEVGESFTLTFYWEALAPMERNWEIFLHLDSNTRQLLDHVAVDGLYPTSYWEPGQIIVDRVTADLAEDTAPGDVRILLGFFPGDDTRMAISDPGTGTVHDDGRAEVGTFAVHWEAPTYIAAWAREAITVDGRDNEWARIARTSNWGHPSTGDNEAGLHTWAKLLYDETHLYAWIHARDLDIWSTMTERDQHLWEEEVVELYLDPGADGRDYVELQFNPHNAVFDARFEGPDNRDLEAAKAFTVAGLTSEVTVSGTLDDRDDRDRRWVVELAIPIDSVPGLREVIDNDGEVGMNLYRYDRPADGEVHTAAWSTVGPGTFHNPVRFGILTFGPAPAPPADADGSGAAVTPTPVRIAPPSRPRVRRGAVPSEQGNE